MAKAGTGADTTEHYLQTRFDYVYTMMLGYGLVFLLPCLIGIIAAILFFIERDCDTSKNLRTIPVTNTQLIMAKISMLFIFSIAFCLTSTLSVALFCKLFHVGMVYGMTYKIFMSLIFGVLIVAASLPIVFLIICFNKSFLLSILLAFFYSIFKFYTAKEALDCINTTTLDLAILDIMLPDMNGLALCQRIREHHHFPIIMLTAKNEETDKITGLTLGADDYITKPFRPLEVIARVKAQLRRYKKYNPTHSDDSTGEVLSHSGLVMNIKTHECLLNEQPLVLTPTEFSILQFLLEHKGNVVSSEELFHHIWKNEYYSKKNNTITVHIRHLREKMKDSFDEPRYIKTIWGCGYKIEK